jgi:acyl carrier protein
MNPLELELKQLIVSALKLEDLAAEDISSEESLFDDEGLGLDSIDALELGMALRKRYALAIETVNDEIRAHFANVGTLARFIAANRRDSDFAREGVTINDT